LDFQDFEEPVLSITDSKTVASEISPFEKNLLSNTKRVIEILPFPIA
jgi:hypothetical protein